MKKRLTVDPLAITKIVKGYYEQFYANKIKILNEMDELLGKKKTCQKDSRRHRKSEYFHSC